MPSPVLAYLRLLKTRFLPHGMFDVVWQVLLFAMAYYGYRLVRGAVDGKASESFQHARELISVERSLHSFVEPTVQAWATSQHWIIDTASYMYVHSHFTVTIAALVYIYLFHNSSFYFVRNMFMIAMGIALIGYVVFPTAPPRFMPEWGFTDSVARFTGIPADDATINWLYNPFAAVPSMHVGFALMLGLPLARLVKWRVLKVIWLLYPLLVTFVVVSTGNHWWLDAFLGALTAAVSAYVADRLLARARPHVWAFGAARVEAPA
jgi:membrane-associated phospholipid phosphatase